MATAQLYYLLGTTAIIGAAFMLVTLPFPALLFSAVMKLFQNIMNTKDTRMDALNEMLSAIRIVKFFGWEGKFVEKITAARENELNQTRKSYIRMALAETVWFIVSVPCSSSFFLHALFVNERKVLGGVSV